MTLIDKAEAVTLLHEIADDFADPHVRGAAIAVAHIFTERADALPARGVGVKPLEWAKHPSVEVWRCDTLIGTYKVFGLGPLPSWDFDSATNPKDATSRSAESLDDAKAAAQADYEARILAALEGRE